MKTTIAIPTDGHNISGSRQGEWTVEDWEQPPDDGNRYEIIEGHLYRTTAPSSFHQWIVQRLYRLVGIPAEDQGLAFAFIAPIGVIGVPEYAVVDPARRQLRLYRQQSEGGYGEPLTFDESDTLAFNAVPAITFRVSDLFANAPDTTL